LNQTLHAFVVSASLALPLWPALAAAQDAPTTQTQPAAPAASEEAQAWLERIDAAGQKLKTLQGTLRYEVVQGAMGDKQVRMGSLYYDAAAPAKFAVHFDRLLASRRLIRDDRWYIFDGQWLVEKMVEQKQFIKRQLVDLEKTQEDGQPPSANPLADGQGPFALPITLKKDAVLRKHRVDLIAFKAGDPANSIHLKLTPHVLQRGEFSRIDLWYDTTTLLPVRVQTIDETENETTVILSEVKIDEQIESIRFDTAEPPASEGWTVELKPLD